jgi:DNA-binding NtrC family response regulator
MVDRKSPAYYLITEHSFAMSSIAGEYRLDEGHAEERQQGDFREDLYYRVNVIELSVPPPRERQADIPLLAEHIMSQLADKNGITAPKLSSEALQELKTYSFPGNVRELENILERALTWAEGEEIHVDDLSLLEVQTASAHRPDEQLEVKPEQTHATVSTACLGQVSVPIVPDGWMLRRSRQRQSGEGCNLK